VGTAKPAAYTATATVRDNLTKVQQLISWDCSTGNTSIRIEGFKKGQISTDIDSWFLQFKPLLLQFPFRDLDSGTT